ncbi:plasmid pRiA4b ORF-3 family protein [uncultured Deefgea sp.]|uniref:plasmid pRiA4b ORF-3 family protein n=1 Tax=uncultured Deefgea sp. TaxID=1304914 RepID=UPI00259A1AF0|nr:plasmid pRiA4b ORF-3 family protein [uncultured Deefgea sp.]
MPRTFFPIYSLYIELVDTSPPIWREFWVDGRISLDRLHHIIQAVMGWSDKHLHEFEIGGQRYKLPDPEADLEDLPSKDSRRAKLHEVAETGDEINYMYDYGDHWQHRIRVLSTENNASWPVSVARVTMGEGACPPEDVGGSSEFGRMLELFSSNDEIEQAEAEEFRSWLEGDYDPKMLDIRAINASLDRIAYNKWGEK